MKHTIGTNKKTLYSLKEMLDLQKELNAGLEKLTQYISKFKKVDMLEYKFAEATAYSSLIETIRITNSKIQTLAESRKVS